MYAEFTERLRALVTQADKDASILEPCGFLWVSVGMPDEGIPLLTRVIRHEDELGHKERVAEMREILKSIREGWNPVGAGRLLLRRGRPEARRSRLRGRGAGPAAEGGGPSRASPEGAEKGGGIRRRVGHRPRRAGQAAGQGPRGDRRLGPRDPVQPRDRLQGDGAARRGREGVPAVDEKARARGGGFLDARRHPHGNGGRRRARSRSSTRRSTGEAITAEQHRDLRYHKAVLLSRGGQEDEAGKIFIALAEEFPGYRDVDARAKRYRP